MDGICIECRQKPKEEVDVEIIDEPRPETNGKAEEPSDGEQNANDQSFEEVPLYDDNPNEIEGINLKSPKTKSKAKDEAPSPPPKEEKKKKQSKPKSHPALRSEL